MQVIHLSKGGSIIETTKHSFQLGAPPETIKDSLSMNRPVPEIYIAPKRLFSHEKMLSVMDVEFPCNYNFFTQKKKTTVICTESQKEIIYEFLKETILGPEEIQLELEYEEGANNPDFPDIKKEFRYFQTSPIDGSPFTIDDIVEFITFDTQGLIRYDGIEIRLNQDNDTIQIIEQDKSVEINWEIVYAENEKGTRIFNDIFLPPNFGITTLGSSHGFDPKGKTSGFIFWLNGIGVMVDPPVDSSLWLIEQNVSPKMVNSVILTHCHSDHDSGVMQKILQEGRVRLYTTPTIFSSFVKKVSLLTGLPIINIIELIDFVPITIGKAININGAKIMFKYRLHSIPTIGFEITFKNKSVVYTSDHLNDQSFFDALLAKKVLTPGRHADLSNFDWNKDIILHEAGVPPLHTPINTLLKLSPEIKDNIYLVHTDKAKLPPDSGLKISPTGLANTMIIDSTKGVHGEAIQILNLMAHIDIFEDTPLYKGSELLSMVHYLKFKAGDILIKANEINNRFFILLAGKAKIDMPPGLPAHISSGSYFGESSILKHSLAQNTITAVTDIIAIVITSNDFLSFISNLNVYEKLQKLATNRRLNSLDTINASSIFSLLTINQKNNLETYLEYVDFEENEVIEKKTKIMDYAYLWHEGEASLLDENDNVIKTCKKGDFIGSPGYIFNPSKAVTLIAQNNSAAFRITRQQMSNFFKQNPRLLLDMMIHRI